VKRIRRGLIVLVPVALAGVCAYAALWGRLTRPGDQDYMQMPRMAAMHPDFADTVIPPNIAPLNFVVDEPGTACFVVIAGDRGEPVEVSGRDAAVCIPDREWQMLLQANRGGSIRFDVRVMSGDGQWRRFEPFSCRIAREEIDRYLVYRFISITNYYPSDSGISAASMSTSS
jgi:hypothetical protein